MSEQVFRAGQPDRSPAEVDALLDGLTGDEQRAALARLTCTELGDWIVRIALLTSRYRFVDLLRRRSERWTYPQQPFIAAELRAWPVQSGGPLPAPSRLAWEALDRARQRLGFLTLSQASIAKALPDVVSEAIEEVESRVYCSLHYATRYDRGAADESSQRQHDATVRAEFALCGVDDPS